ncbi:hypothetical protein KY092_20850 [Natronomonas gomsonensis]|uniref:DUF7519 family protein n=1 Tax=Natronomonas gomsonensis TaxID=1046043 RepID=UPI00227BD2DC|nr:hypothetical protein [Natronomonas gomsonensis]MCY4732982.1 hypothetical protein [Natronomonas gomsonensis]
MSEPTVPERNWRPTKTAASIAVSAAIASTLALAVVAGPSVVPAVSGLVSGVALAATVRTSAVAERRIGTAVGGLLAVITGIAFLGGLLGAVVVQTTWPPVPPIEVLALAPFLLAGAGFVTGFGAFSSVWDLSPTVDTGWAAMRLLLVTVVPLAAIGAAQVEVSLRPIVTTVFGYILTPPLAFGSAGMVFFRTGELFVLFAVSAGVVRLAVVRIPFVELASEASKPVVTAVRRRVRQALAYAAAVSGIIGIFLATSRGTILTYELELPPRLMRTLVALSVSPTLRGALVAAIVAALGAVLLAWALRFVASERFPPRWLPIVSLATGGVLTMTVAAIHRSIAAIALDRATTTAGETVIRDLLGTFGSFSLLAGALVGAIAVASALAVSIGITGGVRALGTAAGTQLAAAGVFVAALAAGIAGSPVLVVFGGVAASLLVWDLGEFAVTLGGEIGHLGSTRRGEIVHTVGATVIAALAVAIGTGAVLVTSRLPRPPSDATALVLIAAAFGTVTLLLSTR